MPSTDDAVAALRAAVQRAVRRVCPRWLADRSEDLVQVAVMRVLDAMGRRFESSAAPSTSYLYKVAYTTMVDEIRRLRRRPEAVLDDDRAEAVPSADQSPEDTLASREVGSAIQDCLACLGRPRRLAVTLHLQGHTLAQAAGLLGWDAKRTENLIYRGLADLRRCLEGKGVRP